MSENRDITFAEKCRYWRAHGLQVSTKGLVRPRETVRVENGVKVREIFDPETRSSVYHHSNDDSRQDVTVRPGTVTTSMKGV